MILVSTLTQFINQPDCVLNADVDTGCVVIMIFCFVLRFAAITFLETGLVLPGNVLFPLAV